MIRVGIYDNHHLKSSFVDRRSGVGNAQKSADGPPQFAEVIGTGSVADGNSGTVEQVNVETADPTVRSRDRNVLVEDVGRKVRTADPHQIRTPLVVHSAARKFGPHTVSVVGTSRSDVSALSATVQVEISLPLDFSLSFSFLFSLAIPFQLGLSVAIVFPRRRVLIDQNTR